MTIYYLVVSKLQHYIRLFLNLHTPTYRSNIQILSRYIYTLYVKNRCNETVEVAQYIVDTD